MSSSHRKQHAGARPADLEALHKSIVALRKSAGRQKTLTITPHRGKSPCVRLLDDEGGEYLDVRSPRDVLDSLRPELHAIWREARPQDLERWFHEARGHTPAIME